MKNKTVALSVTERCRNILGANCQAHLNTIKADAKGRVTFTVQRRTTSSRGVSPTSRYMKEICTTRALQNIIIDERDSLSVSNIVPGPLMGLLRSMRKLPARVPLAGDVIPLKDDKVQMVTESPRESLLSEYKKVSQASYAVSALLCSASVNCISRCEILQEIVDQGHALTWMAVATLMQNVDAPKSDSLCKV